MKNNSIEQLERLHKTNPPKPKPKIVSSKQPAPTQEAIDDTIARLRERLAEKPINRHCNAAVKEGYTKAIDILENRIIDITKSSIGDLKTVQGRAIASCAIDYLAGWCSAETLCEVPIKKI